MIVLAANDPRSTRIVYAMVIGLALVGVAFVMLGVWLVRRTRIDPEVLAPLERMGDRDWRARDPATQRRMLDERRPLGAEPLRSLQAVPVVDAAFHRPPEPRSLDELVVESADVALPDPIVDDPGATGYGGEHPR